MSEPLRPMAYPGDGLDPRLVVGADPTDDDLVAYRAAFVAAYGEPVLDSWRSNAVVVYRHTSEAGAQVSARTNAAMGHVATVERDSLGWLCVIDMTAALIARERTVTQDVSVDPPEDVSLVNTPRPVADGRPGWSGWTG